MLVSLVMLKQLKFAVQTIPHLSQLSKHSPHPQFQAVLHNPFFFFFPFFNHIKDQGLKSKWPGLLNHGITEWLRLERTLKII